MPLLVEQAVEMVVVIVIPGNPLVGHDPQGLLGVGGNLVDVISRKGMDVSLFEGIAVLLMTVEAA